MPILLIALTPTAIYATSNKTWDKIKFKEPTEVEVNEDSFVTSRVRKRLESQSLKSQIGNNTKVTQQDAYDETVANDSYDKWEKLSDSPERKATKNQTINGTKQDIDNIINLGMSVLGNQYSYGGNDPYIPPEPPSSKGIDCSAFVKFCYEYGANITMDYRTTREFLPYLGKEVSQSEMQVGDIVMFSGSSNPKGQVCHTGIYIGNKKVLHASGTGTNGSIRINTLNGEEGKYHLYSSSSAQAVKAVKRVIIL